MSQETTRSSRVRRYHAASWDEGVVYELGAPGRRGVIPPTSWAPADDGPTFAEGLRRDGVADLPELAEYEVRRHFTHLAQQTLGMMGISLFGTCTMKHSPTVNEQLAARPEVAAVHPRQDASTMQGLLGIVHDLEAELCNLSGMSAFSFQPGGGADAAYLNMVITRAHFEAKGELGQRRQVITTAQAHPCNPATAKAAGFEVVTLPVEEDGYPSLEAFRSVIGPQTAAIVLNNPDDMGVYNPFITEVIDAVHAEGGLAFYDSANFNGVMTRLRARDLGFDACMYMLHKTFGAPKGGNGPSVGAYGCSDELAPFLPGPRVERHDDACVFIEPEQSVGRVREFFGNVPQLLKAYSWTRAMGTDGLREAADLSVLANNYMEHRLMAIPGVTMSFAGKALPRLEMTRYSLEEYAAETGLSTVDVQNRMTDFGIDAYWLAHEPWIVPEPFTPEAGEMWSKEDLDEWIDVLEHVLEEGRNDPELVRTAPHRQVVAQIDGSGLDDPERWATTWAAYRRKHATS
ncbi:aminomethyl-transferring glycine dehydrogenase subunit GcvPB [Plantibacter sp. ME-Dv--P-122b]|uniref:aminomethyl-transferring glycine dehydrogenase subunit GcvPB n=1 Tax=Plantibacter sp. ME-Dv--P-122b TaxID=3040300 RepID=UPI00254B49D7|nr:aminomethyl-transferring glycine dehydrogenase subunit GcvPB [Plantibacter sp. ME-Dv--P-122b]